jgi:nitroreductase
VRRRDARVADHADPAGLGGERVAQHRAEFVAVVVGDHDVGSFDVLGHLRQHGEASHRRARGALLRRLDEQSAEPGVGRVAEQERRHRRGEHRDEQPVGAARRTGLRAGGGSVAVRDSAGVGFFCHATSLQQPADVWPRRRWLGSMLMEFQEVVLRRHMVRTFTSEPVPPEVLGRILGNAVRGPSAGFSQGQAFLVVTGEDLAKFWAVAGEAIGPSAQTAPLVIVPMSCKRVYLDRYAEPDKGWTDRDEARWPVPFWHIDTGMAALLILLTTVDENLGAVYFGIIPPAVPKFRDAFGVPDDHEPIGAIAIGYDAEPKARDLRSRRRPLDQMVHYGHW